MLLDILQEGRNLRISKINKDKNLEFLNVRIPSKDMFEWSLKFKGQQADKFFTFWKDGSSVYRNPTTRLNKFRVEEIILNLPQETQEYIYEFNEPFKLFCDIETEVIDGFPDVKKTKEAVTVVGLFNNQTNSAIVLGTKELKSSQISSIYSKIMQHFEKYDMSGFSFDYKYFSTEFDMLYHLFSKEFKDALVVTGWNFIAFDWEYLINRAKKLGISPEICAEDNKLSGKEQLPLHKLVVDYLDIFKKWAGSLDDYENLSLDEVSRVALGEQKIKYNGTLQQLYETDFENYVFYNIVDVMLVHFLDKKMKSFLVFGKVGHIGRIEAKRAFSPVHLTEMLLCRSFYKLGRVLVQEGKRDLEIKYAGGFVKEPITGFHEMVAVLDFASLYPTIMRMFDISPDSYLGFNIDESKISESYIKTSANTFFRNDRPSIMRTNLDSLYGKRKSIQKEMVVIEMEINELKKSLKS